MFVNPLDRVPQVPVDWANHVVYGGALGLVVLAVLEVAHASDPAGSATAVVFAVAAAKKLVDYLREGESVEVCIGKAFVTAVWPASIWLAGAL